MHDPIDTLRNVRDVARDTAGITAHDLAHFESRSVDDVLTDLDRLRHEGLVDYERAPFGSVFYTVRAAGEVELAQRDGTRLPAMAPERLEI